MEAEAGWLAERVRERGKGGKRRLWGECGRKTSGESGVLGLEKVKWHGICG